MDAKNWITIIRKNKKRIIKEATKVVSAAYNLNLRFIVGIDVTGCTYSYNAPTKAKNIEEQISNYCDLLLVTPEYINVSEDTLIDHFECALETKLEKFSKVQEINYKDTLV